MVDQEKQPGENSPITEVLPGENIKQLETLHTEVMDVIQDHDTLTDEEISHLDATWQDYTETLTTPRPRRQTVLSYLRQSLKWKRLADRRAQRLDLTREQQAQKREAARERKNNALVAMMNHSANRILDRMPKTTEQKLTDTSWSEGLECMDNNAGTGATHEPG